MPGGDRTGPMGMGPMTGSGAGYCAGYPVPGYMNPIFGRGGFGCARGWGRGMGRGFGWTAAYPDAYGTAYMTPSYPANVTPKQEADMLRAEAKAMQDSIGAINQRIKDLEAAHASEANE
ncbi:MAG: DUF5320 domain-containing protein [Candidatus Omnitrophica bacterium]|nr:DUF5320 domain-containing protein [Candidatus Omnitrophota bacterium]